MNTTYQVGPSAHPGSDQPAPGQTIDFSKSERARVRYNDRVELRSSAKDFSNFALVERAFDFTVCAFLLLALLPLLVVIAIAILVESEGSVLSRELRVGIGGRLYHLYRFRTCRLEAGGLSGFAARATVTGRLLSALRVVNLPVLFNVFSGEMGLVGPTPASPRIVAAYSAEEEKRLAIRPGLTGDCCFATIPGAGDKAADPVLYYIQRRSAGLHVAVLAGYVLSQLRRRGSNSR